MATGVVVVTTLEILIMAEGLEIKMAGRHQDLCLMEIMTAIR